MIRSKAFRWIAVGGLVAMSGCTGRDAVYDVRTVEVAKNGCSPCQTTKLLCECRIGTRDAAGNFKPDFDLASCVQVREVTVEGVGKTYPYTTSPPTSCLAPGFSPFGSPAIYGWSYGPSGWYEPGHRR